MNLDELLQQAMTHRQSGRFAQARQIAEQVISLDPSLPRAWLMSGICCDKLGDLNQAIVSYSQFIQLEPNFPEGHESLGNVFFRKGDLAAAEVAYRRFLLLRPADERGHFQLSNILASAGKLEDAIAELRYALILKPEFHEALVNLANLLHAAGKTDEAILSIRRALQFRPDSAEALSNLGNLLREQGKIDLSLEYQEKALAHRPDFVTGLVNYSVVLGDAGRFEDALIAAKRAIAADTKSGPAHFSASHFHLILGQFPEGWREFEWRWNLPGESPARSCPKPRWDGAPIAGKTILLYAEQGFGDTIQFSRFASLVADRGAKVILECQRELVRLLQNAPGITSIIPVGQPPPHFDVHCSLLSLPGIFKTDLSWIPEQHLFPDSALVDFWMPRMSGSGRKIGLAWAGKPQHQNDRRRSIPPELLRPLAKVHGAQFFSLQKIIGRPALKIDGLDMLDFRADLSDFADTAAMIANLDLVLTADTAVAHLAGAMRKPVWVMLPRSPDWRWMLGRNDSPWYPTMRLFRQREAGDWQDVIARVIVELEKA